MKTIKEAKVDLDLLSGELYAIREANLKLLKGDKKKSERATVKRIVAIRDAIKYLEFRPTMESITRQKSQVASILQRIEDSFDSWKINQSKYAEKKMLEKPYYYKQMNRPKYLSEERFLDYLIG